MSMTPKQRNFFLMCGVLIAVYYVGSSVIGSMRLAAFRRQQAAIAAQQRARAEAQKKAAADAAAKAALAASAPAKFSPLTTLSNISGLWMGQDVLAGRGLCTRRLELREAPDTPGNYTGYSTLSCIRPPGLVSLQGERRLPNQIRNQLKPTAIIMTGAPENGAILFHVDKTVVGINDDCATSAFTVTPFGTNKIAAQWQEGSCQGGQVILNRQGR